MGSKISYLQIFVLIGGIMTVVFGLLTAFIPGLFAAWVMYDSWRPELGWHIEYLSMQPQIYSATFSLLISSVGGVFGIMSMLKDDVRFLRLGFLGIFLGLVGVWSPMPVRGVTEQIIFPLPLPASILSFLGVVIMFSSLVYKSGGLHRLALLSMPILGIYSVIFPITAFFDLQFYARLSSYRMHEGYTWNILLLLFAYLMALIGCFLCFLKTFTSSSTKHNGNQIGSQMN